MLDDQLDFEEHKFDDPASRENNLEYDLVTTDWILKKVRASTSYAQNLYAAMCNNSFSKNETGWYCSWRYAGGIVANMRQEGDYIDWYCSGIRGDRKEIDVTTLTEKQRDWHHESEKFVGECVVTDEISEDLEKLGWIVSTD